MAFYWFEDLFDAMPGNYYTRHMSGMLVVGLVMYGFMALSQRYFDQPNHYYVQGVGYATIMDILGGDLTASGFLLLLVVAKPQRIHAGEEGVAAGGAALHGEIVHEDRALVADAVDVRRLTDHQAAMVDARLHKANVVEHCQASGAEKSHRRTSPTARRDYASHVE